jgi:16S rRNA (guanine527-N7)-methyltransferase
VADPFEDAIERLAASLGPPPGSASRWPALRERAARFARLASEWNQHLDLTAAAGADEIAEILVADALVLARHELVHEAERVLDVGSGAGGPALALAILREDLQVALLEPKGKRVAFLRTVIGTLGLAPRVRAHEGRIEPKKPSLPAIVSASTPAFDVSTARATFEPKVWADVGLALAPATLVLLATEPVPEGHRVLASTRYALPLRGSRREIARLGRAA